MKHQQQEFYQLLPIIRDIRQEHGLISAKMMYYMMKPDFIGRDKFISTCMEYGYKMEQKRNRSRTTDSYGVLRFPNYIKELKIEKINQVWVSDITYYRIGERFYYLTFIMDLKSRYIVGHHVSKSLRTDETTLAALKIALKNSQIKKGLIFHSDGGGQYYSDAFVNLTSTHKIINSMTQDVGENNHAERINGTIKNQYLSWYMPTSFSQLEKSTQRAVNNYNHTRPHQSLSMVPPSNIYSNLKMKPSS